MSVSTELPLLAPGADSHVVAFSDTLIAISRIVLCIGILVVAGRYLLNPFLALLASTGAREVMTAAALLVVLGAAALMQFAGMSMALGAFLAGVLLAGSNYRHELEADIEPFRGLLLALFFMGVGMSIDMGVVTSRLALILAAAIVITLLKAASWPRCSVRPARTAVTARAPARCSPPPVNFPSC